MHINSPRPANSVYTEHYCPRVAALSMTPQTAQKTWMTSQMTCVTTQTAQKTVLLPYSYQFSSISITSISFSVMHSYGNEHCTLLYRNTVTISYGNEHCTLLYRNTVTISFVLLNMCTCISKTSQTLDCYQTQEACLIPRQLPKCIKVITLGARIGQLPGGWAHNSKRETKYVAT